MIVSLLIGCIVAVFFGRILYKIAKESVDKEGRKKLESDEIGAIILICIVAFCFVCICSNYIITPTVGLFMPVENTVERYTLVPFESDEQIYVIDQMPNKERYIVRTDRDNGINMSISRTQIRFDSKNKIRMLKMCKRKFREEWYNLIARSSWLKKPWNEIILVSEDDIAYLRS